MEAALFQDTPALLAAQLDPKTQKAAEEAFAQQQRSNPRQLASELVSCLGNAQLNPAVRQLAATDCFCFPGGKNGLLMPPQFGVLAALRPFRPGMSHCPDHA